MENDQKAVLMDALGSNPYVGITIVDKNGSVIFRNMINEDISGIKNDDILKKDCSTMPHYEELKQVLKKGIPEIGVPYKTANGCQALIHRIPLTLNNTIIGAISITTFSDVREVKTLISKYDLLKNRLTSYNLEFGKLRSAKYTFKNIIGNNNKILMSKKLAQNYALGKSSVLITGETGTGKELFAHAIHLASPRKEYPFIRVNCGSIPPDLLESELFGYEPGAFTGAGKESRIGKFELAHHGTIFLDEISSLNLAMQPKLLAVLQNHEIERIGGNKVINLDFRIISATNKSLSQMVQEGLFRSDLYYRLNVFNLDIPPLRERLDDIPILAKFFLKALNKEYNFNIGQLSPSVLNILSKSNWPGNVRELQNVLERAAQVSNKSEIKVADLPDYLTKDLLLDEIESEGNHKINILKESKDGIEKKITKTALISNNWNKSGTARQLGISRSLLYALIKKYDLKP
ncbi:MAG: sigma 54-interacting transcriptional regulator [Desulfosarcina sp.]|nr:sigma 54-interacting transcriptional regulator [Desulfobacterales bacterium]